MATDKGAGLDLTTEQAVAMRATGWWKTRTPREIVSVQLFTEKLIMPFGDFRAAVDEAMGRLVSETELAYLLPGIKDEFLGVRR